MVLWIVLKGLGIPEINAKWCTWIHAFFFSGGRVYWSSSNSQRRSLTQKTGGQNIKNQPTNLISLWGLKIPLSIKFFYSLQNKLFFRSSFALLHHLMYDFPCAINFAGIKSGKYSNIYNMLWFIHSTTNLYWGTMVSSNVCVNF